MDALICFEVEASHAIKLIIESRSEIIIEFIVVFWLHRTQVVGSVVFDHFRAFLKSGHHIHI